MEFPDPDCDMTRYLEPNLVNWSFPAPSDPALSDVKIHRHIDTINFLKETSTKNLTKLLMIDPTKKYSYFNFNQENLLGLRDHKLYKDRLSWMQGLDRPQIHAALYKRLFKLSPNLQGKLQA